MASFSNGNFLLAAVFCPLQIWKCTQILSLSLLLQLWGTPIAIPSSFNSCSSSTLKWSSFEAKLHAIANVFKWNLLLPRCEFFWIFANFLKKIRAFLFQNLQRLQTCTSRKPRPHPWPYVGKLLMTDKVQLTEFPSITKWPTANGSMKNWAGTKIRTYWTTSTVAGNITSTLFYTIR